MVVGARLYFIVAPDWRLELMVRQICVMISGIPTGELLPFDIINTNVKDF